MQTLARLAAAAFLAAPAFAQLTVVAPNGYASTVGNANNTFPWARGTASMRYQQIFDSSHFTLQGIGFPVLIQELKFRPFAGAVTSWAGGSWPNVRIDLASSPVDFLAASTTFASNLGPDLATVYNGQVTVNPGSTLGAGVVVPWHVTIPLTTPFLYDPNAGNDLTLDVHLDGTGWTGTSRACDTVSLVANNPLMTRIFSTAGLTATTGTVGTHYGIVCEFTYVPANGLFASFRATPSTGTSPLAVTFTDTSYSSAPGGVLAWAWDFDNDGITDSSAQNPTWTYTGCGDFSPRLTVFDAQNPPDSVVRTNLIRTDLVTADFTATAIVPGVYQFTDTSAPTPTAWAWDFDNDGITDSTAQNPVHGFGSQCSATVKLTATLNCRTSQRTRSLLLAPASLSSANGTTGTTATPSVGNFFNIQVLAPEGILVCGLTGQTYTGVGAYTASVYITPDTYLGKDTNASVWRLVAQGQGFMNGGTVGAPSVNEVPLNAPFYLPQGDYGVAVYHTAAAGAAYISYTSVANGPFSNSDLVIHPSPTTAPGLSRTGLFGGSAFGPPRPWCGTFHYTKVTLNQQAGYGVFGLGCAGPLGVTNLSHNRHPQLGQPLTVTMNNLPLSSAIMMTGFSRTSSVFGPLPFSLAGLGAAGCSGLVSPDATLFLVGAGNSAAWTFNVPNNSAMIGVQMFQQALVFAPGFNALGGVTSDAAGLVIGL
ncbi:MAG: PKD domain-containing protein [Planctomycetes bacterium]|nr:PKD domain-containing protein [Planctomycetota bacterium]